MANKEETNFRNRIVPKIKALPNTRVFSLQQLSLKDDPDLLICINSWFIALELKKRDGKLRPLQRRKLLEIRAANGFAIETTPDNWDEVYAFLEQLAREERKRHELPDSLQRLT